MPLVETRQPIPQEVITPRRPGETVDNALELPETRKQVDLGSYNPSPENVKNNWKLLGHLPAVKDEDLKIDFIKSLSENDEAITAKAKAARAKRDDPDHPDATDFKKIGHIFTLRKMLLGHDWRAENVAKLAAEYINEKIRTTERDIEKLKTLPPEQAYLSAVEKLKQDLREYQKYKANLEAIMRAGYPNLLEKNHLEKMPADLERLRFESITVKGEIIYFKTIHGRHSWNSGLVAAGNELKEGVALGLKIKYPDKSQAQHLLENAKHNLPANTNVGTFIEGPGAYIILHGDNPRTNTTDTDRSLNYANTEIIVFVVPDDKKAAVKK